MTNRAKQIALKLEMYAKFPYLFEIKYYDKDNNLIIERYANCDDDIVFNGHTYQSALFSIKPPNRSNSSISDGQLKYSVIDQSMIQKIRNLKKKRAKLRFLACIVYDDENNVSYIEAIDDITFTLTKCNWNETSVSWNMMFDDRMNLQVPCDIATIQKVPALA